MYYPKFIDKIILPCIPPCLEHLSAMSNSGMTKNKHFFSDDLFYYQDPEEQLGGYLMMTIEG